MMGAFRAFYKSWAAKVLFGLLALSFVIWGASTRGAFNVHLSDAVVKAGSRQIDEADFKQKFQDQLKEFGQKSGQAVTTEEAVQQGLVPQALEDYATEEAVQDAIRKLGVRPSDELVIDEIRKIPAFFNPVTGVFEEQTYEALLGQHNLTPTRFQDQISDQLALQHFSSGVNAGLRVPATYAVLFGALDQQTRSADYFMLDPRAQPTPAKPTDAQLTQLMNQFADRLRQPENRQISIVRISAQALANTLHPSEADVQKQFDNEKARLSVPERRSFVQIQLKDASQAAAAAARLNKGEDASAVARSYGVKPISYADVPEDKVDDPAVAKAAFALKPGQVSGPIQGQFGYSVAKLVSVTPAKAATLQDVRPQIEKELNDKAAKDAAYEEAEKYSDAHAKGQTMDAAAKAAGTQIYKLPYPITADGKIVAPGSPYNGAPLPALNDKMLKDAFSQPKGGETDITDLGSGEYYAIRVDKITPPALPSLDQVRGPLTNAYMQRELINAMKAKADALVTRVKKGEAISAVAASAGAKVQHLELNRASAEQQQQVLGQQLLGGLFNAKAGDVFDAQSQNFGVAIVKVDQIRSGSPAEIAKEAPALRTQLSEQMGVNELGELFFTAARNKTKPKIDLELAYQALGVQPPKTAAAAPGGKASGKAK